MDELNRWARDDLRSLNAQIEFLLREAVRKNRSQKAASDQFESEAETEES